MRILIILESTFYSNKQNQYCYDNIDRPLPITMIEFLSQHCSQALSTKDYEHMARENDDAE